MRQPRRWIPHKLRDSIGIVAVKVEHRDALRARSVAQKAAIADALRRHVWPLLETQRLQTFVHTVFPLREVCAAHELMESSAHIGKIMLEVRPAA